MDKHDYLEHILNRLRKQLGEEFYLDWMERKHPLLNNKSPFDIILENQIELLDELCIKYELNII